MSESRPSYKSELLKINFYFSTLTYVVGTQKNPSHRDSSIEHPKQMLQPINRKKIFTILSSKFDYFKGVFLPTNMQLLLLEIKVVFCLLIRIDRIMKTKLSWGVSFLTKNEQTTSRRN